MSSSLAMATFQAVWVYVWSFFSGELLALGGNSGNVVYDVRPPSFSSQSSLASQC